MIQATLEEFGKLTNAEAYARAFNGLLMRPDPERPGSFLGNSQRADFIPLLKAELAALPSNPRILDVGAGAGEIVPLALGEVPRAILSLEEPNEILLAQYRGRLAAQPGFELGAVYTGPVQDFTETEPGRAWLAALPEQDLCLAIHMVYHLTPFQGAGEIDPDRDLIRFAASLFGKLRAGGRIFVVYADQERSTTGGAGLFHYRRRDERAAGRMERIWRARNRLFREGGIAEELARALPGARARVRAVSTPSRIFGRTLEELAVMGITGEMGDSDSRPFDASKIASAYEFLRSAGDRVRVAPEPPSSERAGMIGADQPQVVCVIEREAGS